MYSSKKSVSILSVIFCGLFSFVLSCGPQQKENPDHAKATPLDVLKAGNEKFVSGHAAHPHVTPERIRNLKKGQNPIAVVVSCSDSRIPPEIIFDQGLGDIFIIRTAGNVIGDYELGSIEYAVEHLHCSLVVVMGHENCGAIQAYAASGKEVHNDHIQSLISYIASEEEIHSVRDSANIDLLVKANISHGVHLLKSSTPVLKHLVDNKELEIIGAYYDLDSGSVLFEE